MKIKPIVLIGGAAVLLFLLSRKKGAPAPKNPPAKKGEGGNSEYTESSQGGGQQSYRSSGGNPPTQTTAPTQARPMTVIPVIKRGVVTTSKGVHGAPKGKRYEKRYGYRFAIVDAGNFAYDYANDAMVAERMAWHLRERGVKSAKAVQQPRKYWNEYSEIK